MGPDEPLWATGPAEILRHAVSLLQHDSETNRRLAMIAIDNSVELMMNTFISLPKRVTGIDLSRSKREEICADFSKLLDGMEAYASKQLTGINLGEVEWFHRIRNQLYHQGNGLSVDFAKVEAYAVIARAFFKNLFGIDLKINENFGMKLFGEFITAWLGVETILSLVFEDDKYSQPLRALERLRKDGTISEAYFTRLTEIRKLRNELVHGKISPEEALNKGLVDEVNRLAEMLSEIESWKPA